MLTLQKEKLNAVLSLCEKAIERKSTIPVLQNVMIAGTRSDGEVTVTATNLDIEITARIPATFEVETVAFTCPGMMLKDIASKANADDIRFEPSDRNVTVRAGRARFQLQLLPVSDFPALAPPASPASFDVPAEALAARLQAVSFAVSTEETRYYLNGIFLHRRETPAGASALYFVATDGHRLSCRAMEINDLPDFPGVIIPRATLPVLAKLIDKNKDAVRIEVTEGRIRFSVGAAALVSKLVDGTFPEYQRVIPDNPPLRASAVVSALAAAIDRVKTVAGDRDSRMRFEVGDDALTLKASNADLGDAEDTISAQETSPHATAFNGKYALEALSNLGAERVEICQEDSGSPAILRAPGATTDLMVLMPMRL